MDGNDTMIGLGGADVFRFTTALNSGSNLDHVVDFQSGLDRIQLGGSVFAALGPVTGANFVVGTAATSASPSLIYDPASGALYYDADGTGAQAQVQFAVLDNRASLSASDFSIVQATEVTITEGGIYRLAGATGEGISLQDLYPGATKFIFATRAFEHLVTLKFGPDTGTANQPEIVSATPTRSSRRSISRKPGSASSSAMARPSRPATAAM